MKAFKLSLAAVLALPLMGLAALLVSPVAGAERVCDDSGKVSGIGGGLGCAKSESQPGSLRVQIQTVTNVLLFLIGAVSVIMLIIGGFKYVVSNGDSSQITSAKNTILYAVIGIVVALLAYAIVNFVVNSFVGDDTETVSSLNNAAAIWYNK